MQETTQVLWAGVGESVIYRLIGVTDAHPVTLVAGQQAQDIFLGFATVLRLVFQDEGPLVTQTGQEVFIRA